jgi:signal transduction histidine kinase
VHRLRQPSSRITLAIAAALLIAGLITMLYLERSYEREKVSEVSAEAGILGSTVAAALIFDDRKAAQEYVNAVGGNPEVQAAAVYDSSGALFVKFSRLAGGIMPDAPPPVGARLDGDRVTIVTVAHESGKPVGTVYLQSVIDPVATRLMRYGIMALLVTMAAVIVALLGITQRTLAGANAELEDRVRERTAALETANQLQLESFAERKSLEQQLRQSQKMEAVGRLTGGIAHDFNNLLGIITGNLDLLLERIRRDPEAEDLAREALAGALRGAELTQRMLAFARKQPLQPKILDLNETLPGMTQMLRRTLREDISIATAPASGLWRALCDKSQVEDAILNLAINARDAMPNGGKLLLETGNIRLDEADAAENLDASPGDYVMLAITDSGVGMPPDVVERAFEPFFTTKPTGQGTGLGLSMVYGFATQSGGHVRIYSEVGHGTTVKLFLPRAIDAAEALAAAAPVEAAPAAANSETILVVEDDAKLRRVAVKLFKTLGYTVLESDNAKAALDVLANGKHIDLVFSDVVMPGGMTGFDLAAAVKVQHPHLKLLLTTGYSEVFARSGAHGPDRLEVISKPYRKQDLATKVRAMLDGSG